MCITRASLIAQLVKNLPAMQEILVKFLGQEDLPEKGMTYPLQYSGLENSMDSTVYSTVESMEFSTTKRLSLLHYLYKMHLFLNTLLLF